jgi:CheY-like chemotaxis protein
MLLKVLGNETYAAHDGIAALELAEQLRPEIVLLDIGMPKLNGYDVCRALRERDWGRQAAIVALTGWGQEDDRRKSREAGFDRHLTKPADLSVLMQLLKECGQPRDESSNGFTTRTTVGNELASRDLPS